MLSKNWDLTHGTSVPVAVSHLLARSESYGILVPMHKQERTAWHNIKERCYNKKRKDYERYGGRGITMCPEWRASFRAFLQDVGPSPSVRHQIERINNDGPYAPGNVRWATALEQANNKRNNHFLEYNGRRLTISEWERLRGVKPGTLKQRALRGWSVEKILTEPVRDDPVYAFNGRTLNISQWSRELGVRPGLLFKRLRLGWPIERILSEPPHGIHDLRTRR